METNTLYGTYRILNVLGNHDDTIIYLAQHVMLLEFCIIKKIDKADLHFLRKFKEVQFLKILNHPCIPKLLDVFETKDAVYFVEQYFEGSTLQQICDSEQLSEQRIISYGIQLCNLIYYLHTADPPMLHLDIKPSNLIVHNGKLALIDFSAASFAAAHEKQHFGTRFFAAPEQYQASQVSIQTDIYSVGAVLYYMTAHSMDKNQESIHKQKLLNIISCCLSQKEEKRYDSILKVGSLLSELSEKKHSIRKELCCYSVAGTQHRIGATHFALQLAAYLQRNKKRCLYVEHNLSHTARELIREQGELSAGRNLYECHGIGILPYSQNPFLADNIVSEYDAIVYDYGTLTAENSREFAQADRKFLLYGTKPSERKISECIPLLGTDLKSLWFLGNFQTAQEFEKHRPKCMTDQYVRLPYEPECWDFTDKSMTWKLLWQIIRI